MFKYLFVWTCSHMVYLGIAFVNCLCVLDRQPMDTSMRKSNWFLKNILIMKKGTNARWLHNKREILVTAHWVVPVC